MMAAAEKHLPRILFLDHVGELGGAELGLIDLTKHMQGRCKVILLADGPLRLALEKGGANVTVLPAAPQISQVRRSSGLRQSIRTIPHVLILACRMAKWAKKYDIIWANSQKSFVIGCFAAFLARRPLVWHMHDILTADHFSPANRKISVGLANRFASRVVTVSQAGLDSFINSGGRSDLARLVYNGITLKTTPPDVRTDVRTEFGIGKAPLVGVFGRITPWKGQDILIRALTSLPGVHAVMVGDALFKEHDYAQSLRTLAIQLGVADRVHFAGFRHDVPAIMSQVDVIAHTSTSPEPFGRVIVEAMLSRKPIIATAAGGAKEILTHLQDGLLVQPGNPDLLAIAIHELLDNPALALAMVEAAYKTATTKFTLDGFLSRVDSVVAEVITPRGDSFKTDSSSGRLSPSESPQVTEIVST